MLNNNVVETAVRSYMNFKIQVTLLKMNEI